MYCIFFSLAINDDIIQIAAIQSDHDIFNRYVWPQKGYIPSKISRITGIEIHADKMFHNSIKVPYSTLHQGLKDLFDKFCGVTFYAHNATFDARMLVKACDKIGIDIATKGISFCNTLPLFKEAFPGQVSYKQESLVHNITGETYDTHNAMTDVKALMTLFDKVPNTMKESTKFHLTINSVKESIANTENKKKYLGTNFLLRTKLCQSIWLASYLQQEYQLKPCNRLLQTRV